MKNLTLNSKMILDSWICSQHDPSKGILYLEYDQSMLDIIREVFKQLDIWYAEFPIEMPNFPGEFDTNFRIKIEDAIKHDIRFTDNTETWPKDEQQNTKSS